MTENGHFYKKLPLQNTHLQVSTKVKENYYIWGVRDDLLDLFSRFQNV